MYNEAKGKLSEQTGSPLSLSNVGTPFLPVLGSLAVFLKTLLFLTENLCVVDENHGDAVCPISDERDKIPRSWLAMDVKVRSGKERRVVEISYDVKFKKDDDARLKRETMQSQPNRDKFQELEADERKKTVTLSRSPCIWEGPLGNAPARESNHSRHPVRCAG